MRLILLTAVGAFAAAQVISGIVVAQSQPGTASGPNSEYGKTIDDKGKPAGEGRTTAPETKGQPTPQGWSGPINTGSGGAPDDEETLQEAEDVPSFLTARELQARDPARGDTQDDSPEEAGENPPGRGKDR